MKRKSLALLVASAALTALPTGNADAAVGSPVCVATRLVSCRFMCIDGLGLHVAWVAASAGTRGGVNASCGGAIAECSTNIACTNSGYSTARATTVGTCRATNGHAICSVYGPF